MFNITKFTSERSSEY